MIKFTDRLGEPLLRLPVNPSSSLQNPVLLACLVNKGGLQPCLPHSENNYEALEEIGNSRLQQARQLLFKEQKKVCFILPLISMSAIKIATLLVLIALAMGLRYRRVDAAS
jgi:hypothetical protein